MHLDETCGWRVSCNEINGDVVVPPQGQRVGGGAVMFALAAEEDVSDWIRRKADGLQLQGAKQTGCVALG